MRFFGFKKWNSRDIVNDESFRDFLRIYGTTITTVFADYEYQSNFLGAVLNGTFNGIDRLPPKVEYINIVNRAIEIFIKSGKTWSDMKSEALLLKEICDRYGIAVIFFEHEKTLQQKLDKYGNSMEQLFLYSKPLPKRIEFQKLKKRRRGIKPLLDIQEDTNQVIVPKKEPKMTIDEFQKFMDSVEQKEINEELIKSIKSSENTDNGNKEQVEIPE